MKNNSGFIFFISFIIALTSCTNDEVLVVFKEPTIELVAAFSTGDNKGEVVISLTDVFQKITETGIVWSDKVNPTINDNFQSINNLEIDLLPSFKLENLQVGKTYFARAFVKLPSGIKYSNEVNWVQSLSKNWTRVSSPPIGPNEFIYGGDVGLDLYQYSMLCYKANLYNSSANLLRYTDELNVWDIDRDRRGQVYSVPLLFNPIRAQFRDASDVILTLYGIGSNVDQRGIRSYRRNISILESNGSWKAYPGAEALTTSFGIEKLVYVLENLPNGKLWIFNYGDLTWSNIGNAPYAKAGVFKGFSVGKQFFMLVEPEDNQAQSNQFYEYFATTNKWVKRADFIGNNRREGTAFVFNKRIFYGLGRDPKKGIGFKDIWEYDIQTNTWQKNADYPGVGTIDNTAIEVNNKVVIGFGKRISTTSSGGEDYQTATDFWRFTPN